ncbi:MAG: hypothetical protein R3D03_10245 [Geminicoccaceae bacterium]
MYHHRIYTTQREVFVTISRDASPARAVEQAMRAYCCPIGAIVKIETKRVS